jgi:hypothetical protein
MVRAPNDLAHPNRDKVDAQRIRYTPKERRYAVRFAALAATKYKRCTEDRRPPINATPIGKGLQMQRNSGVDCDAIQTACHERFNDSAALQRAAGLPAERGQSVCVAGQERLVATIATLGLYWQHR